MFTSVNPPMQTGDQAKLSACTAVIDVKTDFRKALQLRPDLRSAREGLQQLGAAP